MRADLVIGEASVEESAEMVRLNFKAFAIVQDGAMKVPPLAQHVAPGMMLLNTPPDCLL